MHTFVTIGGQAAGQQRVHQEGQEDTRRPATLDEGVLGFLTRHRIDSFGKVWFLLFLWQREGHAISRSLAPLATFSDAVTLDETIGELEDAGLLLRQEGRCVLRTDAGIERDLAALQTVYEDPLTRRQLLSRLYQPAPGWDA